MLCPGVRFLLPKPWRKKQTAGELQNMVSFDALVAVSVHPLPHNVVGSIVWSIDQPEYTWMSDPCLLPEAHPSQRHV